MALRKSSLKVICRLSVIASILMLALFIFLVAGGTGLSSAANFKCSAPAYSSSQEDSEETPAEEAENTEAVEEPQEATEEQPAEEKPEGEVAEPPAETGDTPAEEVEPAENGEAAEPAEPAEPAEEVEPAEEPEPADEPSGPSAPSSSYVCPQCGFSLDMAGDSIEISCPKCKIPLQKK